MILLSRITDAQDELFDEMWVITNNYPKQVVGAEHHPELSPNRELYTRYRAGLVSLDQLLTSYSNDLHNGVYNEAINELLRLHESGKWIQLMCYCEDYKSCHRRVLYEYLVGLGIEDIQIM